MAFPLADLPPISFVVAPVVVLAAYVVFGITGFGATVIIVPLLAQVLPLKFLVPLCVTLDLSAFILLSAKSGGKIDRAEVRWVLPFMLIGIALGAFTLAKAPERTLILGLGIFITGYAVLSLTAFRLHSATIKRGWGVPVGIAGGISSALFGIGGPLYAIYVSRRTNDAGVMRATMSTLILMSGLTRFTMFIINGLLLSWTIATAWLFLLPCVWGGATLGMKLHDRLSIQNVRRAIYVVLLLSGSSLIVRALAIPG
ncbi:MAG TPA: sulfite exporter TauE/SafE family protein [Burkholderiales bacterium]